MPKRNLEVIRSLLLRAESVELDPGDDFNTGYVDFMDQVTHEEGYHLGLMRDAGLIEGRDAALGLFRITNAGHDYLDVIRSDNIWSKTKEKLAEVGGTASLEVVKALAIRVIANILNL